MECKTRVTNSYIFFPSTRKKVHYCKFHISMHGIVLLLNSKQIQIKERVLVSVFIVYLQIRSQLSPLLFCWILWPHFFQISSFSVINLYFCLGKCTTLLPFLYIMISSCSDLHGYFVLANPVLSQLWLLLKTIIMFSSVSVNLIWAYPIFQMLFSLCFYLGMCL